MPVSSSSGSRPALLLSPLVLLTALLGPPDPGASELPRGVWPLDPRPDVVRRFDPPENPYGSGHRGVDLLGRPGQRVRVALGGTVAFAGSLAGKGVVSVRHGALRTTYEPVTATVHAGDQVARGSVIGVLQVGPSHCRPRHCLHWGLIRGETYLDPLLLVGAGPVRLLPLSGGASAEGRVPASSALSVDLASAAVAGSGAGRIR